MTTITIPAGSDAASKVADGDLAQDWVEALVTGHGRENYRIVTDETGQHLVFTPSPF